MIRIKKFYERFGEKSIDNIIEFLKPYLNTPGTYIYSLVDISFVGSRLLVELDVTSAFPGGKSERDKIKNFLHKNGFSYYGNAVVQKLIEDENDRQKLERLIATAAIF